MTPLRVGEQAPGPAAASRPSRRRRAPGRYPAAPPKRASPGHRAADQRDDPEQEDPAGEQLEAASSTAVGRAFGRPPTPRGEARTPKAKVPSVACPSTAETIFQVTV